jgi:hypothetical protein
VVKDPNKCTPFIPKDKEAYITFAGVMYDVGPHIERHLKDTVELQLEKWTISDGAKKISRDINMRTQHFQYHLINVLMLDDDGMYGCLLVESKSQSKTRRSLDTGKKVTTHFGIMFWTYSWMDDDYDVHSFFMEHNFITIFKKQRMVSYLKYYSVIQNGQPLRS